MRVRAISFAMLIAATAAAQQKTAANAVVRDLHVRIITPSSDALFTAESKAPGKDSEWLQLETSAKALADAATALSSLPQATVAWITFATTLRAEATTAARAAKARNVAALIDANGRIVASCEACHDDYRDAGHGMTSDKANARQR